MDTTNYGYVTKEWVLENNPLYLERSLYKPIGVLSEMNSLINEQVVRYYRDGRVERKVLYTTEHQSVDNTTILSPFGVKMIEKKRYDDMVGMDGGEIQDDNCNNFCN